MFKTALRSYHLRQAWYSIMAIVSAGLMVWAGTVMVQHPCTAQQINDNLTAKCSQLPWDLIPIAIALVFWLVGLSGWYLKWDTIALEFFFTSSGVLAMGLVSGLGYDLGFRLFYILLAWFAPLIFQFHGYWLQAPPNRAEQLHLRFLQGLALIASVPFVLFSYQTLVALGAFSILKTATRLLVVLAVGVTVALIVRIYRGETTAAARYRARMVFFGIVFAIAPLALLYVLPSVLGSQSIPADYNFPWLLLIPLSYGYSILRPRLVKSEAVAYHAILYFLLAVIVLCFALLFSDVINRFNGWSQAWLFFGLLLTMFGVWVYSPIRQALSRLVMWILYGGQTRYLTVIEQTTQMLTQVIERRSLGELLVNKLMQAMPLSGAALLLVNERNTLTVQSSMNLRIPAFMIDDQDGGQSRRFDFFLRENHPIQQGDLLTSSWSNGMKQAEQDQMANSEVALWIPLVSNDRLLGILLLGQKLNNDFFNLEDQRVIGILAHQAGIAAYNVLLVENITAGQEELAKANQQLLTVQDNEQSRLARADLHDVVIQQLIGLSYQSSETRKKMNDGGEREAKGLEVQNDLKSLQENLLGVVSQIRSVIRDLRPVGLDELGLTEALEADLTQLKLEVDSHGPQIKWDLERSVEPISYPVKINLFRIAQEAVKNAIAHAEARCITVSLHFQDDTGLLEIIDDGTGFSVPERLSQFAQNDHFGLLGINERTSNIDGQLTVESQPDRGTRVSVKFQL